jgi:hypothetical protein
VNANVGSFGSASAVPTITANAKGLITAVTTQAYQNATSAQKGIVQVDGTTITASGGVITAVGAAATSIAVGTTTISSGTSGRILYDNAGVLGEFDPAPITNSLSSNVALSNTSSYFDGPSVAQGSTGTWFASGTVTLLDTANSTAGMDCKLWDGTTVIASARTITPSVANIPITVTLSGFVAAPAGNIRISCKNFSGTTGIINANLTGSAKDSTITAHRIK